jgi:hypothetical protein
VIHYQSGEVCRDLQVLPWVIGFDVKAQLVAAVNQARQQLVDAVFFLVGPFANRIHQLPPVVPQIRGGLHPPRVIGVGGEELLEVVVVEIRV